MTFKEVPSFVKQLKGMEGIAPRALEFLILTACRSNEILGAQWDEIDLKERVWVLPAQRMKAGKEHRVPLSNRALEILQEMEVIRINNFIFPGMKRAMTPMTFRRVLSRLGLEGITVHGFRSSFRTWAAEQTDFPREICEMALAHTIKGQTEASYWRTDMLGKRRELMEACTKYCED
jgi:integrase